MNTTRFACVIGSAIVASTLHAQSITGDFDAHQVGSFPVENWHDITDRTVGNHAQSPNMSVIETTDAHGNPTLAAQTNQTPRTNGLYQLISPKAPFQHVSMDVRVDSMHSANAGWLPEWATHATWARMMSTRIRRHRSMYGPGGSGICLSRSAMAALRSIFVLMAHRWLSADGTRSR